VPRRAPPAALSAAVRLTAIGGGVVLVAVALLTLVSVIGRALFSSPVPGDFELVEIGCAIAVFAFLPYCHLVGGHVVVDFVTAHAPQRLRAALDALASGLFTVVAALLTWRLALGGIELHGHGETSMILRVPLWWGFAAAVPCMALFTIVCAWTTVRGPARDAEERGGR